MVSTDTGVGRGYYCPVTIKISASYWAFSDTTSVGKWVAHYSQANMEVQTPWLAFTGTGGVGLRLVSVKKLWSKLSLSC